MPTFYEFRNNSSYNPEFASAVSILSRSEMVDQRCPRCGVRDRRPSGAFDVKVEGGSEYPDVLRCGAYPFLIVSEAVIRDWEGAGVTCFHTYPVGIAEVRSRSKRLKATAPPAYFRVEIDGSCRIDLEASGLQVISHCPECHHLVTEPAVAKGFRMVEGSWDGYHLFRDIVLYPRVSFCTELILQLASEHRRTNFRFDPMEGPIDTSSRGIEYLKRGRR